MVEEKLTEQEIQRFRDISIHELIGIQNNGRNTLMRCPFPDHDDSTPSFSLSPENKYKCFGCGKQGIGAISFVRDLTGKDKFLDILTFLLPYV